MRAVCQLWVAACHVFECVAGFSRIDPVETGGLLWLTGETALRHCVGGAGPVCIKPALGCGPEGVAQLQGPGDLAWYAVYALAQRAAVIPPGVLAGQPDTVALAVPVPAAFVIEPLIETDGCGPKS